MCRASRSKTTKQLALNNKTTPVTLAKKNVSTSSQKKAEATKKAETEAPLASPHFQNSENNPDAGENEGTFNNTVLKEPIVDPANVDPAIAEEDAEGADDPSRCVCHPALDLCLCLPARATCVSMSTHAVPLRDVVHDQAPPCITHCGRVALSLPPTLSR